MLKKILSGLGYVIALVVLVNSSHGLVMWRMESKVEAAAEQALQRTANVQSYYIHRCFQLHKDGWLCDGTVTFVDGTKQEIAMIPVPDSAIR